MRKIVMTLTAVLLLSTSAPTLASLLAQAYPQAPRPPAPQAPTAPAEAQAPPTRPSTTQIFTGKISKKDNQFVLENRDKKTSYKLDDATKADEFDGKEVRVIGSLDAAANMIHVQSIEESGS